MSSNRGKLFFFLLASICIACNAIAQKYVELNEHIVVSKKHKNIWGEIVTLLPKNIEGKQEILEREFSTQPHKIEEKNGIIYAIWKVQKLKLQDTLKICIKLKIDRYDLFTAKRSPQKNQKILI